VGIARAARGSDAEMREPAGDGGEIVVLRERVERDPQSEPLGQRNLLLYGLARVHFFSDVLRLEVLREVLRQQVATIRRGVDQHVTTGSGDRAVEHHLERLVRLE